MSKKIPTAALIAKYEQLLSCERDGEISAKELITLWKCSVAAFRTRLFHIRFAGLEVPRIVYTGGWREAATDGKRYKKRGIGEPKRKHAVRGLVRGGHRNNGYAPSWLGEPDLPICPKCAKAGRVGLSGEPVHLHSDGVFVWCEVCAYEPAYDGSLV